MINGDIRGHPHWTYKHNSSSSWPSSSTTTLLKSAKWDWYNFEETILLFCWDEVCATSAVRLDWVYTWAESSVIARKRPGILPVVKMTSSVLLHVQRSLVGVFSWLKNLQLSAYDSNHKEPGRLFALKKKKKRLLKRLLQNYSCLSSLLENIFQILQKINYSVTHCARSAMQSLYNPKSSFLFTFIFCFFHWIALKITQHTMF